MVIGVAPYGLPRQTTSAPAGSDTDFLAAFSSASADWGNGVEAIIEEAYRKCFRTYIISGRVITLHLPFAENNERSELAGSSLAVEGGGKADPLALWDQIDAIIASGDFARYTAALSDGHEKVISFDLAARSWTARRDWYAIDQMKAGSYLGLPHRPTVLASGKGLAAEFLALRPGTPVLFMSAMPKETIARSGERFPATPFLEKPFSPSRLARRVRELLDGTSV